MGDEKILVLLKTTLFILLAVLAVMIILTYIYYNQVASPNIYKEISNMTRTSRYVFDSIEWVELVVLVDNNPFKPGLRTAWGLSIYIKTPYDNILFDTGPSPDVLEYNAYMLNVDLTKTRIVVLSHRHGDHTGGLNALDEYAYRIKVYVPLGFSPFYLESLRARGYQVEVVNDTVEVSKGVYILKPLYGPPWEQALVIIVKGKGLVILTGCSHPGVDNIVREAVQEFNIKPYMVIGGFHLAGASLSRIKSIVEALVKLDVEKIYPLHCSGDEIREYLEHMYPELYGEGGVGLNLTIHS